MTGGRIAFDIPPIDIPDVESHPRDQVIANLSVSDSNLFPWWFKSESPVKLPKDSAISFAFMSPSEWETRRGGSYIVRLDRSKHYKLDIHVTPWIQLEKGLLPENYQWTGGDAVNPIIRIQTYVFRIQADFIIQRDGADATFVPGDYEVWIKTLFASLRNVMEN